MTTLVDLPTELLCMVADQDYLSADDCFSLALTCRTLNHAIMPIWDKHQKLYVQWGRLIINLNDRYGRALDFTKSVFGDALLTQYVREMIIGMPSDATGSGFPPDHGDSIDRESESQELYELIKTLRLVSESHQFLGSPIRFIDNSSRSDIDSMIIHVGEHIIPVALILSQLPWALLGLTGFTRSPEAALIRMPDTRNTDLLRIFAMLLASCRYLQRLEICDQNRERNDDFLFALFQMLCKECFVSGGKSSLSRLRHLSLRSHMCKDISIFARENRSEPEDLKFDSFFMALLLPRLETVYGFGVCNSYYNRLHHPAPRSDRHGRRHVVYPCNNTIWMEAITGCKNQMGLHRSSLTTVELFNCDLSYEILRHYFQYTPNLQHFAYSEKEIKRGKFAPEWNRQDHIVHAVAETLSNSLQTLFIRIMDMDRSDFWTSELSAYWSQDSRVDFSRFKHLQSLRVNISTFAQRTWQDSFKHHKSFKDDITHLLPPNLCALEFFGTNYLEDIADSRSSSAAKPAIVAVNWTFLGKVHGVVWRKA
ncbi:hypothetical protein EJ05DRAFT_506342 [Pseudovirgaria hyperparasitica]|uniref:F-box domain-containing protein n=1 Tax=Pseudovirgaria hyperparasitica TaxID=470096 RepID=A0A6A6WKD2_9PEZI|nr:uncharacterized protein EJ05DRAFT_506342 [Pseudovirgaria hyperparasitica]KAF2762640.1 hypothetical protein EJ05DRAFT_506342 [Pseudovirgaria hyperparasitica]